MRVDVRCGLRKVLILCAFLAMTIAAMPSVATAVSTKFGGDCVLHPGNRGATIDSLRFHCSAAQQAAIYHASPRGAVPMGAKDGWVTTTSAVAPPLTHLWMGKTFRTDARGGSLLNRTSFGDIWPAEVYPASSRFDGKPAWALNYAPSPTPTVYDEIREVTPGVWLGYTLWPGVYQTPFELSFILA